MGFDHVILLVSSPDATGGKYVRAEQRFGASSCDFVACGDSASLREESVFVCVSFPIVGAFRTLQGSPCARMSRVYLVHPNKPDIDRFYSFEVLHTKTELTARGRSYGIDSVDPPAADYLTGFFPGYALNFASLRSFILKSCVREASTAKLPIACPQFLTSSPGCTCPDPYLSRMLRR